MKIDYWIIRNLNDFNNCLIPKRLVEKRGLEELSKELSKRTGFEVEVALQESCYVTNENHSMSVDFCRRRNKTKKINDTNYIAKVLRR